jgi:isopentenyl diphosphate isomerase/L-lactate dehydrogenase-like FMN-dependent dehydrogenase
MDDLRARAAELLDPAVLDYYDGFSGAGQTGAEANASWSSYRLRPRALIDVSTVDTTVGVGGVPLAIPLLAAPAALTRDLIAPGRT